VLNGVVLITEHDLLRGLSKLALIQCVQTDETAIPTETPFLLPAWVNHRILQLNSL